MKTSFVFITVVTSALLCAGSGRSIAAGETVLSQSAKPESPFACNAFALSAGVRKRHFEELGPALLKLKKSTRDLPDGFEFELPPSLLPAPDGAPRVRVFALHGHAASELRYDAAFPWR